MFPAFPIVFQQYKGWGAGPSGLAFLGIMVGMLFALFYALLDNMRYMKIAKMHDGMAPAEARLPMSITGSILIPIGLFWFAWTTGNNIHWIVPIIGSAFFACGIVLTFLSLMNYLIDSCKLATHPWTTLTSSTTDHKEPALLMDTTPFFPQTDVVFAASVLAANAVLRSLFGAAFPLFTDQMYANLGIHWAASVPAFLALACIPFPLAFYRYGPQIRARCKFAAEAAKLLEELRGHADVEDPDAAEDDAMQEVEQADRIERLAKSMSRQSRRSHRDPDRVERGAAGDRVAAGRDGGVGGSEVLKEV